MTGQSRVLCYSLAGSGNTNRLNQLSYVKYYKTYTDEEENSKISIQDDVVNFFQEKKDPGGYVFEIFSYRGCFEIIGKIYNNGVNKIL